MIVVMRWEGASLKTPTTPRAILDLEFADNAHRLNEVLSVWSVAVVKGNIWLDFLFIVSYVLFLSIAAEYSAMKWPAGFGRQLGLFMARAAYIAGVLDISENLLMLQSIAGSLYKPVFTAYLLLRRYQVYTGRTDIVIHPAFFTHRFTPEKMSNLQDNPWTINSEKEVYTNPWITVTEYDVLNPAGGKGIYGKIHLKIRR